MSFRDDSSSGHRAFALPGSRYQYGPDRVVVVEHIDLHLTPDLEKKTLDGVCTTTVRAFDEPVERLTLDAVDMDILFVRRDGRDQAFEPRSRELEIRFENPIAARERATFEVGYRVREPRAGLFFIAPTPDYPNAVRHAWTQSQDQNARHWFPCLDYPSGKQTTSATIVVPRGTFALGNGALVERKDDGDRTAFTYRQDVPHSTYLTTMVAGPFVEVAQGTAGAAKVPVFYYVLPGREADGERSFANTP
jgi:aminopeptidase N